MRQSKNSLCVISTIIGIRKLRNLTQLYMSTQLEIDRSSYCRIELASIVFTHNRFKEIANYLDTPIQDIILIADLIECIEIEGKSYDQITSIFFNLYNSKKVNTNFNFEELRIILLNAKRYYSRISRKALNNTTSWY